MSSMDCGAQAADGRPARRLPVAMTWPFIVFKHSYTHLLKTCCEPMGKCGLPVEFTCTVIAAVSMSSLGHTTTFALVSSASPAKTASSRKSDLTSSAATESGSASNTVVPVAAVFG